MMPAKSKAQNRLMQAIAHNPDLSSKTGISSKVAKHFTKAQHGNSVKNLPEKLPKRGSRTDKHMSKTKNSAN